MDSRELLDCVVVAFVESNGLALFDLRLDGGLAAKVPGYVVLHKLLEDRVLDHDSTLSGGDIPFVRLHTVSVDDNRVGRSSGIVCKATRSASIGVVNAGKEVEADRHRLILQAGRIIADSAFVSQARIEGSCRIQMVLNRRSEDVRDDKE